MIFQKFYDQEKTQKCGCDVLRFGQNFCSDFCRMMKKNSFYSYLRQFTENILKKIKNILEGLVVFQFLKFYIQSISSIQKTDLWKRTFFLGHLLVWVPGSFTKPPCFFWKEISGWNVDHVCWRCVREKRACHIINFDQSMIFRYDESARSWTF